MFEQYQQVTADLHKLLDDFSALILHDTKELDQYKLTTQQEIIMLQIIQNDSITSNELAGNFNISKSAVSQVISKLESRQLIYRQPNPANKREFFIKLTAEGEQYKQLLATIDERLIRSYYSKVDIEELRQMVRTMKKLVDIAKEVNQSR
ncbi:MarR family transcriptional regulator [Brevibacillus ruminantium]|uniref:MarR family transcriptional regulator n=1 Tax=Brevibacillus ruminantium TaxID=2950604 RepID=A0ABY4WFY2_9BACL|nr:MarR family transcriptional regulator [Brevibacillus ruminantium]USG63566.1 MarR family transcriptional regulator [Brevibacillus ruminantium]